MDESGSVDPATDRLDAGSRLEIVEACTRMAHHADRREWDELVAVFAEEIRVDYTSLQGGDPVTVTGEQLVDGWRQALGGLAATQHLIANHLVDADGDLAVCAADFQATHVLPNAQGDPTWTLGGRYRFELRRLEGAWRIAGLTMTTVWAAGNQQIMSLAAGSTTTTTEEPR
ncbi:MAG: nuclear transport factor 2 family protein [Actinomycetota bacterium]|jgi:3-phenylpropionate/cinnamic acid dioxygenase small subunit|nr:nuclear transport factor 2 family protein [Actinomycetota bacterium]